MIGEVEMADSADGLPREPIQALWRKQQSRHSCSWDMEAAAPGSSQALILGLVKLACLWGWWTGFGEKINGLGQLWRLISVKLPLFFNFTYNCSILSVVGWKNWNRVVTCDWISKFLFHSIPYYSLYSFKSYITWIHVYWKQSTKLSRDKN